MNKREEAAAEKQTFALPENVLNDYLRTTPKSGWTTYLRSACPTVPKLLEALEETLEKNIKKHGDTTEWMKIDNVEMFKNKFLRHLQAARMPVTGILTTTAMHRNHKSSAITNAMFLAYFDLERMNKH